MIGKLRGIGAPWHGSRRARYGLYLPVVLLGAILLSAACGGGERVAKDGDTVTVHYSGTLDNGEAFDSSRGGEPFTFELGAGQVILGFDDAVRGLQVGESTKVRLEPAQAYGEHRDDLVFSFPRSQMPEGLASGDKVQFQNGAQGVILEVTDEVVRVDANHVLAGQALTFEIELLAIE